MRLCEYKILDEKRGNSKILCARDMLVLESEWQWRWRVSQVLGIVIEKDDGLNGISTSSGGWDRRMVCQPQRLWDGDWCFVYRQPSQYLSVKRCALGRLFVESYVRAVREKLLLFWKKLY